MSIAELASLAEIVSAIAVVVTLIYLAIQVKHSKERLRRLMMFSLAAPYFARVA